MARKYMTHDEAQASGSREAMSEQLNRRAGDDLRGRDEAWHTVGAAGEPAFQNAWTALGGYQAPRFKRVGLIVYVQGHVTGGAAPSVAFTLPAGYRPAASLAFQACTVLANGNVQIDNGAAPGPINAAFPADQ